MSATETTPEEKRLYKSHVRSVNVITPQGKTLHFRMGFFATNDPDDIQYLDRAISRNEFAGQIYIDPEARTLSAEQENPMLALRKKIIAEYLAEQAAHTDPNNDMGESKQGPLKAASTTDIAPVAAGGDGAARLMTAASLMKSDSIK